MPWNDLNVTPFYENEGLEGNPLTFVKRLKENFEYLKTGIQDFEQYKIYRANCNFKTVNMDIRVINRNEVNYLGDITWTKFEAKVYKGVITGGFDFENLLLSAIIRNNNGIHNKEFTYYIDEEKNIYISISDAELEEDYFCNIEIKVKQPAAAPQLISAVIPALGASIILTFDKEMSNYFFQGIQTAFHCNTGEIEFSNIEIAVDKKILILTPDQTFTINQEALLTYDETVKLESFDYGLLEAFTDLEVTNNSTVEV